MVWEHPSPKMAERLVFPRLPDSPVYDIHSVFDEIREFNPQLAAGMFEHQYFVLT